MVVFIFHWFPRGCLFLIWLCFEVVGLFSLVRFQLLLLSIFGIIVSSFLFCMGVCFVLLWFNVQSAYFFVVISIYFFDSFLRLMYVFAVAFVCFHLSLISVSLVLSIFFLFLFLVVGLTFFCFRSVLFQPQCCVSAAALSSWDLGVSSYGYILQRDIQRVFSLFLL